MESKSRNGNLAKTRVVASFGASLDKQLLAYAAAATAAGVSMLALAPPSEAKIVYTPASDQITPDTKLALDLNHDGVNDFQFVDSGVSELKIQPYGTANAIWGTGQDAAALPAGISIGGKWKFQSGHTLMFHYARYCSASGCVTSSKGLWKNITRGYLGLKFSIKGKIHYGWARLNVTHDDLGIFAMLTGYAYETIPGKPIVTGRTKSGAPATRNETQATHALVGVPVRPAASLGLLAKGSAALDIWRRRDVAEKAASKEQGL